MKVAILSLYSGHSERGVEVWAESLKKAVGNECEVKIFGNTKIAIDWEKPDLRGKFVRNFLLDYWSILVARFTFSVLSDISKFKPDIIIPTNGGWQALIIRIYSWFFGKKMIIVGHAGIGGDEFWNLLCFPDTFVALSSHAAKWARKKNPFIRVVTIPNGVWLSDFSETGKRISLSLEHPIYLYVGAIESGKRPSLVIEAVSKLQKGSLLMLGQGEKKLEVEVDYFGREMLGDRYKRLVVKHSDISRYYRTADVFTLPTWSQEAFGMVYLEAMASGLPVVTTDDPIKREIIGEAGIFVDPTNIENYSQALEECVHRTWGRLPRTLAEKFSWDEVAIKYIHLFRSISKYD